MTIRELFEELGFEEVWAHLFAKDPTSSRDGYEIAWKEMMASEPTEEPTMIVKIKYVAPVYDFEKKSENDDGGWWDVYGDDPDDDHNWGLDFLQWGNILAMQVEYDPLPKGIAAAEILWEITFYGYSQEEVNKKGDCILERCKEVKDGLEKGNFIPLEDALEDLFPEEDK